MPVWFEIILAWMALSIVVNLIIFIVGRKNGFFKWFDAVFTNSIYQKGYQDGKASSIEEVGISTRSSLTTNNSKIREYGIKDNRYK